MVHLQHSLSFLLTQVVRNEAEVDLRNSCLAIIAILLYYAKYPPDTISLLTCKMYDCINTFHKHILYINKLGSLMQFSDTICGYVIILSPKIYTLQLLFHW